MATVSETGPMIVMGSAKAQDLKAKPAKSGQSHPERQTKRHKGWPAVSALGAPSRAPSVLKLCI
jgi:hypothetical protein